MLGQIIVGSAIGSFVGSALASNGSSDFGQLDASVKALDNRIAKSFSEVDKKLDIIKALQLLDIYGAKRDEKGNVRYEAPDGSRIVYFIDSNDICTFLSTGELFSRNGEPCTIEREVETEAGVRFTVSYYGETPESIEPVSIKHNDSGLYIACVIPPRPVLADVHWYNRGKKRREYMKLLKEWLDERHHIIAALREFCAKFPEVANVPLKLGYYHGRETVNINDALPLLLDKAKARTVWFAMEAGRMDWSHDPAYLYPDIRDTAMRNAAHLLGCDNEYEEYKKTGKLPEVPPLAYTYLYKYRTTK